MPVTTVDDTAPPSSGSPNSRSALAYASPETAAVQPAASEAPPDSELLSNVALAWVDRYRVWVLMVVVGLYAIGFNFQWRLEPDSALYLSIGRNLVEGQGYTYHGKDHRLAYPGVPLLFAGLFKVFGADGNLVPHLVVMWLMGLATLGLTYRLFLLHSGRPTALLITLGLALSRVFYRYTFELLSDLPFLFGVMAFFVGYEAIFHRRNATAPDGTPEPSAARWYDGVLLIVGLGYAVAARPAMWALVAATGLAMIWSLLHGRTRWRHVLVVGLMIGAVALFYLKDPRQQKHDPNSVSSTITYAEEDQLFHLQRERLAIMLETARRNVPGIFENAVAKASFGASILPGLNTILALTVIIAGVLLVRTRPLWGMWVLATLLMVMLVPKPLERYFLPVLPMLVFAWWTLTRWAERRVPRRWATATFLLLFGLGGVPNVMATAGFVFEQRQRPFIASYKKGRYASAYEVAQAINNRTPESRDPRDPNTTWVCVPDKFARIMTFLSRRYCIEPEIYSTVEPARLPHVYVLAPTEARDTEVESRRIPLAQWLSSRGAKISADPIGSPIPNKDPDDSRPWTIHRAVPIAPAPAAAQPASHPATQPGSNPAAPTNSRGDAR
jgi:hypothetical protein